MCLCCCTTCQQVLLAPVCVCCCSVACLPAYLPLQACLNLPAYLHLPARCAGCLPPTLPGFLLLMLCPCCACRAAGHTAPINALAMDPWARFVVTASSDGTARVWDLSSARPVHTLKAGSGEQGAVLSVALSPCTRFAILGCANGTARMYDVISGQCMGVMAGHTGWVHLVRFLPDGKRAVTASHDGTARCAAAGLVGAASRSCCMLRLM